MPYAQTINKPQVGSSYFGPSTIVVASRKTPDGWIAVYVKSWGQRPYKVADHEGYRRDYSHMYPAMQMYLTLRAPFLREA